MRKLAISMGAIALGLIALASSSAKAACTFTDVGTTMTLDGDCTTDTTITIPDGWTLDGQGYTITAIDPDGLHFVGAVVQNAGALAHVTNLGVTASNLANVCDAGGNRLRGIMFEGGSGSITHTVVTGINQGNSGCQEGNAIEVRNAPFDGTHPNTQTVEITNNYIDDYQKTGVVANGDVEVSVTNNFIGSADLPNYIAANSVQIGFGGSGDINHNSILGNQWDVVSSPQWVATAILIYIADQANIKNNVIGGDWTDIGVYAAYSGTVNIMNNTVARGTSGADTIDGYGVGVWFYGNSGKSKLVRNNFVGWNFAYFGADLDNVNAVEP